MTTLPRPLDPHSRTLLEQVGAQAAAVPPEQLTVQRRRSLMREANALMLPAVGPLPTPRQDLVVPLQGRNLPARLYQPAAGGARTTAADVLLVFFHGGGWVCGDLETHDNACAFLAERLGCTLLSVEYRKAPEHPFPAAAEDAELAYAWAWSQAAAWGCRRIAVAGDSAGGHLAAHALYACSEVPSAAALLFYPVADVEFANASYRERGDGPGLTSTGMVWFWQQFMGPDWRADHTTQDARAVLMRQPWQRVPPPVVVTLAWHDPLHNEGLAYAKLLQRAGGQVTLLEALDMAHGFLRHCRVVPAAQSHVEQAADSLLALL